MNTRAKGNKNERRAANMLMAMGYEVERPNYTRYGNKDFFNLWDMVAVKKNCETRWVQVKTNRRPSKDYINTLACFHGQGSKELWIFFDRKPFPVIIKL